MPKYTFSLQQEPTAEVVNYLLQTVPGAFRPKNSTRNFIIAEHGAFLLERAIQMCGLPYKMWGPPLPQPLTSIPRIDGIRLEVYEKLLGYQREALCATLNVNGIYLNHPCGSGKTLEDIIWSEYNTPANKSILVITKAGARLQWLSEIAKFTTRESLAITGDFFGALQFADGLNASRTVKGADVLLASTQHARQGVAHYTTVAAVAKQLKAGQPVKLLAGMDKAGLSWLPVLSYSQPVKGLSKKGKELLDRGSYNFVVGEVEQGPLPRFFVMGWESLIDLADPLLPTLSTAMHSVVFDEIHKCASNKRWARVIDGVDDAGFEKAHFERKKNVTASAMVISKAAKMRVASSATPMNDRTRNLWSQLDLLRPWEWGNFHTWTGRYAGACATMYSTWDTSGSSNEQELNQRLSFVMHTIPREVVAAALPPKRREVIYIPPEEQDSLDAEDKKWFIDEFQRAAARGTMAILEAKIAEAAAKKRSKVIGDTLDAVEAGQKVLIFTVRQRDCERLAQDVVKATKNKVKVWYIHGLVSHEERNRIQQEYMTCEEACVLVATMQSAGEALNLQSTDLMICTAVPINWGQLDQGEGRVARVGQRRPVLIRYLVCEDSDDERIATILLSKLPAVVNVLETKEAGDINDAFKYGGKTEEEVLKELAASFLD